MDNNQEPEVDLNQLMQIRRDKLNKLKEEGKNPFEITKFNRTHTSKQIMDNYEEGRQRLTKFAVKCCTEGIDNKNKGSKGNMYVIMKVITPKKLSREQKKLIESLNNTKLDDTVISKFNKFTEKNGK